MFRVSSNQIGQTVFSLAFGQHNVNNIEHTHTERHFLIQFLGSRNFKTNICNENSTSVFVRLILN